MANRRAISIIEVYVAMVLMAVLLAGISHALVLMAQQRRLSQRRIVAMEEAANVLALVMARPFDEVSPETARGLRLSDSAERVLPSASLQVDVKTMREPLAAKQISVEIAWHGPGGTTGPPLRLVGWKYHWEESGQ